MKKILLVLFLLLLCFAFVSCGEEKNGKKRTEDVNGADVAIEEDANASEGLSFKLSDSGNTYYVSGRGQCEDENIIIPAYYNGKRVTEVGRGAFAECSDIKSIVANNIVCIAEGAFSACTSLEKIEVSDFLQRVESYAFADCTNLKYNEFGNLLYLGNSTNPYVVLVKAKDEKITECIVNADTKVIYFSAFARCSGLKGTEYDNCMYLGNEDNPYLILAKVLDKKITACEINKNTRFIYSSAFYGCEELESIFIPKEIVGIGAAAFNFCTNLTIYCESEKELIGWHPTWNYAQCPIFWGQTKL